MLAYKGSTPTITATRERAKADAIAAQKAIYKKIERITVPSMFDTLTVKALALALHQAMPKYTQIGIPVGEVEIGRVQRTAAWQRCVGEITRLIKRSNPHFRSDKFVTACITGDV